MRERGVTGGSDQPPRIYEETSTTVAVGTTGGAFGEASQSGQMGGQGGQPDQGAGAAVEQAKEKATQVVDTAKEKAGQVAEQVSTKADAGIDKAAGGLDKAAEMLRQRGEQMGGQGSGVQSVAATAATRLDNAAQYLRDKDTDQLVADLEDLVRRKPAQTLLVAAGVGFLLSKVVR